MAEDTDMTDAAQVVPVLLDSSDEALRQFIDAGDDEKSVDDLCAASVHASFSKLFLSEKYHDIVIECGGREFKAHRAVVCSQCPWFEKEFTAIAKKRTIKISSRKDDDPEVFQRFLEFLYTGTYTVGDSPPKDTARTVKELQDRLDGHPRCPIPSDYSLPEAPVVDAFVDKVPPPSLPVRTIRRSNRLSHAAPTAQTAEPESEPVDASLKSQLPPEISMAVNLYIMADKYDIPALKLLARDRFYVAAKARWVTASWEGSSWEDTNEFEDVVLDVYISTRQEDRALWKALCKLIVIKTESDVMRTRMVQVMNEHGDLGSGVMDYMLERTN
ncbi:hypothetical protein HG530_014277 [Fusarium avenaceum]|nr:BTB/POZ protein [Fusarium avenaceum]KAI6750827.1 hypothetical protein HG530_014277 [Fusarium avenaceum]